MRGNRAAIGRRTPPVSASALRRTFYEGIAGARFERMIRTLVALAQAGDVRALELALNHALGKPQARVEFDVVEDDPDEGFL